MKVSLQTAIADLWLFHSFYFTNIQSWSGSSLQSLWFLPEPSGLGSSLNMDRGICLNIICLVGDSFPVTRHFTWHEASPRVSDHWLAPSCLFTRVHLLLIVAIQNSPPPAAAGRSPYLRLPLLATCWKEWQHHLPFFDSHRSWWRGIVSAAILQAHMRLLWGFLYFTWLLYKFIVHPAVSSTCVLPLQAGFL